jgi:hypothetical protein
MADDTKIMSAIKFLATQPDGSINLSESYVSVRKAQKLARASTNHINPILRNLRNEAGLTPTAEALNDTIRRLMTTTAPLTKSVLTKTMVKSETTIGVSASIDLDVPSSQATPTVRSMPDRLDQAGADQSEALARLTEKVEGPFQLRTGSPSLAQDYCEPAPPKISSKCASKDQRGVPETLRTSVAALGARPGHNSREQVGHAAEALLRIKGPLTGVQIYNGLGEDLACQIRPRQIQELLRWSEAKQKKLVRLSDGRWWLKHEPVIVMNRRRPSEKTVNARNKFAALAATLIQKEGRPFGAVELYDAIPEIHPEFVRAHSSYVLMAANNPHLIKLRNGSWWIVGQAAPLLQQRNGYHSRVRADFYDDLAIEFVHIVKIEGGPVCTQTIRKNLSPLLAKKLEGRNMNEVMHRTKSIDPRVVCLPDRRWGLQQTPEVDNREMPSGDGPNDDKI